MELTLEDGKYKLVFNEETGEISAYRYEEFWQDLTGNKLIYLMMVEILKGALR